MKIENILRHVDHTLLAQDSSWEEIRQLIDDAIRFSTASVCIPPSYVKEAAAYANGRMKICTVIGFPNGYSTSSSKLYETEDALKNGADEIDMVINIGNVKNGRWDDISSEISQIRNVCGDHILKVIIETCLLTDEEKIRMCGIVTECKADYIKTSTGFSTGGATVSDIILMKKNVGPSVKIKAAGGISSIEDAEEFLKLGADRLGTSRIVKLVKQS